MNKSYCPLVFSEMYNDSNGQYALCCHADPSPHSVDDMNPFDFWKSEYMEDVRNKMFVSANIPDCHRCQHDGWSFRDQALALKGHVGEMAPLTLKLRINGSYCNLACFACHPLNSSTRRNEMRAVWGNDYTKMFEQNFIMGAHGIKSSRWQEILADIIENIHLVDTINMTGGEPMLLDSHWDLVNAISEDDAKHINLEYDTNLTHLEYKGNRSWDLRKKFKHVTYKVSCDHFGEKLAWMRYPIDVEQFEMNLGAANPHAMWLNVTVSLLNIRDLHEIRDYYKHMFDIDTYWPNIVNRPQFLSIRNLSADDKTWCTDQYGDDSILMSELNKDPWPNWKDEADSYLQSLLLHRRGTHAHNSMWRFDPIEFF